MNIPVGLLALWFAHNDMPNFQSDTPRPLDVWGLLLFASGAGLLSWLLEVFGEINFPNGTVAMLLAVSVGLLVAYGWHAGRVPFPLLRLSLLSTRTFRVSVLGGFATQLGVGGMPFLLPLLYQLGLGLPAWQSGLLMMPAAVAAMGMKVLAAPMLRRFGYRQVLIVNTLLVACAIASYSQVGPGTPIGVIVGMGLALGLGLFNSLQFSSMNSMAYADIGSADTALASTLASTFQQMSMSFGLAFGSLITAYFLGDLPQSDRVAVTSSLHHAFLALAVLTVVSSAAFWTLHPKDGESVSKGIISY